MMTGAVDTAETDLVQGRWSIRDGVETDGRVLLE
jgi:hypothetical protein